MTHPREFSDEELTAFLDGEAEEALSTAITSALTPDLKLRLANLSTGVDAFRAEADSLLASAPPFPDLPDIDVAGPSNSRFWVGAGSGVVAAGLVASAIWLAGTFGGTSGEPWHVQVANYHDLYTPATLAKKPGATQRTEELTRLGTEIRRDLSSLPDVDRLNYCRAQPLGFAGDTLIQIAFISDQGVPFALCILQKDGEPSALKATTIRGMAAATWSDRTHRFILIGGADQPLINAAANVFSKAL